jgi:hypothetical protein
MKIGSNVSFTIDKKSKTGTLIWITSTQAHIQDDDKQIYKVDLEYVKVPEEKKGLLTRFLSLFR